MSRATFLAVLATVGCGDNEPPAADAPAAPACSAMFTGNFAETSGSSRSGDDCASVSQSAGTTKLAFSIPTMTLATSLAIEIDFAGSPTPGTYSPPDVQAWSALALQRIGEGGCDYSAGNAVVPTGSFALTLDTIDVLGGTAHGTLEITQYVLIFPGTECGTEPIEMIVLGF